MTTYSEVIDVELFALVKQGDELAFAEIYHRYWGVLFLHARQMLRDNEEARDVVQELFTSLWQKAFKLEFDTSLSAYLYKSVRNRIFDHLKHKKVMNDYLCALKDFEVEGELITDEAFREKELAAAIEHEISLLPPKMREVFELSRKQYLSYQQIGEKLGISEHTVKSQVSNALRILRTKVGATSLVLAYLMSR